MTADTCAKSTRWNGAAAGGASLLAFFALASACSSNPSPPGLGLGGASTAGSSSETDAAGSGGSSGNPSSGGAGSGGAGEGGAGEGGTGKGGAGKGGAGKGGGVSATAGSTGQGAAGSEGGAAGESGGPLVFGTLGKSVADYLIAQWPELDYSAADCTGPSNCFSLGYGTVPAGPAPKFWEYTYGVPLVGLYDLYERTGNQAYFEYVKKYVDRYVDMDGKINHGRAWPLTSGGNVPSPNDPTIQDTIQPSNLLFGLYEQTKDERYSKAMANTRAVFSSIKTNSAGAFWHKPSYPGQQWLDAIYMSEPFLTRFGATYADKASGDDAACFSTASSQIKLAASHTYDPQTKLYRHAWNGAADGIWLGLDPPSRTPPLPGTVVSPVLWSRSLAWLFAGTVDVLEYMPSDHADRAALLEIVDNVANGLEKYQDPGSGLWYQVIDLMDGPLPANGGYSGETQRPAQPNWLETSASGIFVYGLAKAVRLGILPSHFLAIAKQGWAGVKSRVEVSGNQVLIHGTVVGMSVGGTLNAYTNADFRTDLAERPPPSPGDVPDQGSAPERHLLTR